MVRSAVSLSLALIGIALTGVVIHGIASANEVIGCSCSPELCGELAGTVTLSEQTYFIDKQVNIPEGVEIIGAGIDKTFIHACGALAPRGARFILGHNTKVGGFTFTGNDPNRSYFGAPVEPPGCITPDNGASICGDQCTGVGGSCNGISNALVHDIEIEAKTTTNAVWVAINPEGSRASTDIVFHNIRAKYLYADGVNVHGGHKRITVQNCVLESTGDDGMAVWNGNNGGEGSAAQTEDIAFINNTVISPVYREEGHEYGTAGRVTCYALFGGGTRLELRGNQCLKSRNNDFLRICGTSCEPAEPVDASQVIFQGNVVDESVRHLARFWPTWTPRRARSIACDGQCDFDAQQSGKVVLTYDASKGGGRVSWSGTNHDLPVAVV